MTTIVLGSIFLPEIAEQLRVSLPNCVIHEIDLGQRNQPAGDLDRLESVLAAAEILVPIRGSIDEDVLARSPACRLIQQFGAGVDSVDMAAAAQRNIPVCNVPTRFGGNAESVAEMALLHLIGAGRQLSRLQALVAGEDFGAPTGTSLYGKTVCIVGYGNIGHALVRLLRPFRCRVIGIRRRGSPRRPGSLVEVWPEQRLREGLALADFVIVAVPLSKTTVGLIGADEIRAMKRGGRIVNVSRGAIVDRDALLAGLVDGHIAAAGLDVFWREPVPRNDPVLAQNVVATPHCGGLTDHMMTGTSRIVADNIQRVLSGQRPRYQVRA